MTPFHSADRSASIRAMFSRIAHRYDLVNRLITLGRDQVWRRYVVKESRLPHGGRLLDVATGTGHIAFEARRYDRSAYIVGVDFSLDMMRAGRYNSGAPSIEWCGADALALPFQAGSFHAVTSGYLMRNVGDVAASLREQMRVARPGSRIVCLDTAPPPPHLLRPFIVLYLRKVIPFIGRLVAGDSAAYTYLPESTQHFLTPDELASVMREVGLEQVVYRRFMFGTIAIHTGICPQQHLFSKTFS